MAITRTARKITTNERNLLRRDGQWSEVFCVVDPKPTMWAATLDATKPPATNDGVYEVAFTGGAFVAPYVIGLCLSGATIYVGSAAGRRDLGILRLRSGAGLTLATGLLQVNETSDVEWLSGTPVSGTGTISVVGTTAIVGVGTLFTSELSIGKVVSVAGEARVISGVADNTHATVSAAFTVTASTQAYTIYPTQTAKYLTIVDEYTIWPRDLKTVGPYDTANLTGRVAANGDDRVLGFITTSGTGTATMSIGTVNLTGSGSNFLSLFAPGDLLCIYNGAYGVLTRVVATVADDTHLTVTEPFTSGYTQPYGKATTKFTTEVRTGDQIILSNGSSGEVLRVINDGELQVDVPIALTNNQFYHVNRVDVYMDYDRALTQGVTLANQHYTKPTPVVPIMGASQVVYQNGSQPVVVQLNIDESWGFDATTLNDQRVGGVAYTWQATGGTLSSTTSATPTLTVTTAGVYRVSCVLTPTSGDACAGHRKIYVIGNGYQPLSVVQLGNCSGDDSAGWSASLTAYGSDAASIADRTQAIIYSVDHYGDTVAAIGQIALSANILMVGWVVGESLTIDPELPVASFRIDGPLAWLAKVTGLATAFEYVNTNPGLWTQMYHLTVDRALWHLTVWRSTLTTITDVHLTGDLRLLSFLEGKAGSLSSQLDQIAVQSILARIVSDRYGRVIIELHPQYIPAATRTTPVVQHLEANDWTSLTIQPRGINDVGKLTVDGTVFDGTNTDAVIANAPGSIRRQHGQLESVPGLAFGSVAQGALLARLLLANRNNPYPSISIELASGNHLIDIAPAMYVTFSAPASSNARGVAFTQFPLLPKRVSHTYDAATGVLLTNIEGEGYTDESSRLDGSLPQLAF